MNARRRWYDPLSTRILMGLGAILALLSVSLLLFLIWRGFAVPPPFMYSQRIYQPRVMALCPGDNLEFTITARIIRVPTAIVVIDTIWSKDRRQTEIFENTPSWVIYLYQSVVTRDLVVPVPQIPPGHYEYRQSAQELNSATDVFAVPFEVLDCKGEKRWKQIGH